MNLETRICQNCKQQFVIEPDDFVLYEQMKVSPPTWCPECRMVRRLSFRNERSLYKRTCDLCGAEKIVMYPQETPFPVYCKECWWSDGWNPKSYAKEYDPSRSFFEQFRDLLHAVPRPGIVQQGNNPGSEYANRVTDNRNCYLVFGATRTENSRYGAWFNDSKECYDGYNVQKSERCYECVDCISSYQLAFSQECNSCSDSWFLYNCTNCQNCFGCVNLRNKQYCLFNEQLSKDEYKKRIGQLALGSRMFHDGLNARWNAVRQRSVVPALVAHHSENVSGNWIEDSKNIHRSFNCRNVENARYCLSVFSAKDVMDYGHWGNSSERMYETINVGNQCAGVRFSSECWDQAIDLEYCLNCHSSHDLFGCIGLRKSEFCILNKQYSKGEFRAMAEKIRSDMREKPYRDSVGREYRYGEFFPPEFSPHAYNETIAQELFPLSKESIAVRGYRWQEPEKKKHRPTMKANQLPDDVKNVPDNLAREIIGCAHEGTCNHQCTVAFRILAEDLEMYRKSQLPLPQLCPNCRHHARLSKRNALQLRSAVCMCAGESAEGGGYSNVSSHFHDSDHCPNVFETSHPAAADRTVYCLQCYNAEIV